MDLMDYRRKIIANSPHLASASGAIATFSDGADLPLKSMTVNIEPLQSGTGDPSPTNIRPISGWNGVKVTRTGKNVFPSKGLTQTLNGITIHSNDDGSFTVNGTATATAQFDLTLNNELKLQSGQYTVGMFADKAVTFNTQNVWWFFYSMDAHADIVNCQTPSKTFTLSTITATRFYLRIISGATVDNVTLYPILVYGSDAPTEFEPYNGNTYTISLSSAGTVYGGTLDVVNGVLTVDRKGVPMETLTWNRTTSYANPVFYSNVSDKAVSYKKTLCSILHNLYTPNVISAQGFATRANDGDYACSNGNAQIYARWDSVTTVQDFVTFVTGQTIIYPLANPVTIQLTPQQIRSLYGNNTIFADTGNVALEYWAHP